MLTALAEGVWCDSGPVRIVGMRLTATMTVLALERDELLVHSPIALTPERQAAIGKLGRVTHLYAPNTFHHFWLGEWSRAFPEAHVHAPASLAKKCPELRIDRVHGADGSASARSWKKYRFEVSSWKNRRSFTALPAPPSLPIWFTTSGVRRARGRSSTRGSWGFTIESR
jgi:hypothetical protein